MTTSSFQFLFRMLPPVILVVILAAGGEGQRPDCPGKCGDISITFPFGIGHGCFREGFEVLCNHSRAFLAGNTTYKGDSEGKHEWSFSLLELASISAATSEVRAYAAVSYRCSINENTSSSLSLRMDFSRTPFAVSSKRNVLQGVGWIVDARLTYEPYFSAAADGFPCSVPESNYLDRPAGTNGSCVAAQSCCVAPFPPDDGPNKIISLAVRGSDKNRWWETYPCSYGMLVEESGYTFSTPDIRGNMTLLQRYPKGTPFMLDFAAGNTSCPADGLFLPPDYACVSGNSSCANATTRTRDFPTRGTTITRGYVCKCREHYDGNPYIPNGCQDIDECKLLENPCPNGGICKNRLDGYDCPCKFGMKDDGKGGTCTDVFPRAAQAAVGAIGGILLLVITSFLIILYKEKKKMKEFYKNNGGPLLEKATGIKIFKKGAVKPILRNSNIIGKGGFGEVYKGLLDNKEVAIKKPINGSVRENKQFAYEVIIQSQVIHKNIVRLIGCCLEVEAPLLVYEFISQGSLHDILHETNNKVALNLDLRLSIAAQSADGLAYMHSQANTKILHGDVKPANILLDENFAPKISDFGISRLLAIDKQHTASIIGDMNYMDPVYLLEGLLTEKSDVYSFGVVILELISRRKAIHSDNNSLVKCFLEAHKEQKKATEFFDKEIAIAEDLELLDSLAGMAVQCLSLDVHQRPTMMEVAELLHKLSRSRKVQDVCH